MGLISGIARGLVSLFSASSDEGRPRPGEGVGRSAPVPKYGLPAAPGWKSAPGPLGADALLKDVRGLSQLHPDRVFGSPKGLAAAQWVAQRMKQIGLQPAVNGTYFQQFEWPIGEETWRGQNVLGLLPGTDPTLRDEVVIVAAHHDSQQGTKEGSNDNATGCAAVLAIAEVMVNNPPRRSVLFVTFDGEEGLTHQRHYQPGRRGSRHYAASPVWPIEKTALLVNMDMLGQVHLESGRRDEMFQWASADPFARSVLRRAGQKSPGRPVEGYPEQPLEAQFFTTDAEPLYRLGVPTVNLLSGRDLENHARADAMPRVIPERLERYTQLAFAATLEAADEPRSLADHGVAPGGLMPSFPLVRERRDASAYVDAREHRWLKSLGERVPELRRVCERLVDQAVGSAEFTALSQVTRRDLVQTDPVISEPVLNRLRFVRARTMDEYRQLPKADRAGRQEKIRQLRAQAGLEDLLAGALYLKSFKGGGDYYLQQLPEHLKRVNRGAVGLGLQPGLEKLIGPQHLSAYQSRYTPGEAVELARGMVSGLGEALGQAAFALLDPADAADTERPLEPSDLHLAERKLAKQVQRAKGDEAADPSARIGMAAAFLRLSLEGVRGSGPKWLERWSARHALTEFADVVARLSLPAAEAAPLEQAAVELRAALDRRDLEHLAPTVLAFHRRLAELAFEQPVDLPELPELIALGRSDRVRELAANAVIQASAGAREEARDLPDPLVQQSLRTVEALDAALEVRALYTSNQRGPCLRPEVSLERLRGRLSELGQALERAGNSELAEEVGFWRTWLEPYARLEPGARSNAAQRQELLEAADQLLSDREEELPAPRGRAWYSAKEEDEDEEEPTSPLWKLRMAFESLGTGAADRALPEVLSRIDLDQKALGRDLAAELRSLAEQLEELLPDAEVVIRRSPRGPLEVVSSKKQDGVV
jgi:hypothetical protein